MAAPFAEPLAKDQGVVAQTLTIVDQRRIMFASCRSVERTVVGGALGSFFDILFDCGKARHQMCFTSSGMS
jgi:hypothetical protein